MTTAGQVDGYWLAPETGTILNINGALRYRITDASSPPAGPTDQGTLTIEPGRIAFSSDGGAAGCGQDPAMVWDEISIDNDVQLSATLTEDPCDHGLGRVGEVISLIFLDADTI